MTDLRRQKIRQVLERLEAEGIISRRELRRVTSRGGMLYGKPGSKEDRAIGNTIDRREQPDYFERLMDEMKLPSSTRREVLRPFRDENIRSTLREVDRAAARDSKEAQREVKGGMEGDAPSRDSEGGSASPAQGSEGRGGFWQNFFNN